MGLDLDIRHVQQAQGRREPVLDQPGRQPACSRPARSRSCAPTSAPRPRSRKIRGLQVGHVRFAAEGAEGPARLALPGRRDGGDQVLEGARRGLEAGQGAHVKEAGIILGKQQSGSKSATPGGRPDVYESDDLLKLPFPEDTQKNTMSRCRTPSRSRSRPTTVAREIQRAIEPLYQELLLARRSRTSRSTIGPSGGARCPCDKPTPLSAPGPSRPWRERRRRREAIEGILYISPWIVGFLVFTSGPLLCLALPLAAPSYSIVRDPLFTGLDNYVQLFTARPPLLGRDSADRLLRDRDGRRSV